MSFILNYIVKTFLRFYNVIEVILKNIFYLLIVMK